MSEIPRSAGLWQNCSEIGASFLLPSILVSIDFLSSFRSKAGSTRIPIVSYCILETGSKQYRVTAGDTLEIERLPIEAGKTVTFDRVLLVNNDGKVAVGAPTVSGATVLADVVAHKRGEHKLTFKMKRRKGYHKSIGHRQELTVVKISSINA